MNTNTAATEIGDRPERTNTVPPFQPSAETGDCLCVICKPGLYDRQTALEDLDVEMEAWSDKLVDAENQYTTAGDDPLFDVLHTRLNNMKDALVEEVNYESDRIREMKGT